MSASLRGSRRAQPGAVALRVACVVVALGLALTAADFAGAQTRPLQGGVSRDQGAPSGPPPDVFRSRGGGDVDDKRPYVKDGWFDRCAYERDHPGIDTQMFGQPDIVPIEQITSQAARARYARCAVNSCDPQRTAVCWRNPPPPPGRDNGTNFYPNLPSPSGGYPGEPTPPARGGVRDARNGSNGSNGTGGPSGQNATPNTPARATCVAIQDPLRDELRNLTRDLTEATKSALATSNRIFFGWLIGLAQTAKGMTGDLPQAWSDFLAQPPGVPRQQILDFLSHPNENFRTGYRLAASAGDKLYQDYINDPGGTTGMLLSYITPIPACGAARNAAEAATAGRAVQKAKAIRDAAAELKDLAAPLGEGAGKRYGGAARPVDPNARFLPPVNPSQNMINCVECTLATIREWETGKLIPAPPGWVGATGKLNTTTGMTPREMYFKFGKAYGSRNIAGLSPVRMTWQVLGKPFPMSPMEAFEELATSKDGIGVFSFKVGDGATGEIWHTVPVRRVGNDVRFSDGQIDIPGIYQASTWRDIAESYQRYGKASLYRAR